MNNSNILPLRHFSGYSLISDWTDTHEVRGHWRLYWMRNRGAYIISGGREYEALPGKILLIPPHTAIKRRLERPVYSLYIHFSLGIPFDMIAGEIFEMKAGSGIRQTAVLLGQILCSQEDSSYTRGLCENALIYYCAAMIPPEKIPFISSHAGIMKTVKFMESNCGKKLNNTQLAREAGMSINAFIRRFSKEMGTPPAAFLTAVRLRKAAVDLLFSRKTIDEISEDYAFCERSHFSREFKRFYNCGPAAFRNNRGMDK